MHCIVSNHPFANTADHRVGWMGTKAMVRMRDMGDHQCNSVGNETMSAEGCHSKIKISCPPSKQTIQELVSSVFAVFSTS
jgi:hypothetical protein